MSKLLITIGLTTMLAFSLVLFITFVAAYFSPEKSVLIRVNSYGEADVEMILLSLFLPVSMISTIFAIRRMEQKEKESYILNTLEQKLELKDELNNLQ